MSAFEEATEQPTLVLFKQSLLKMQANVNIPSEYVFFEYMALISKDIHYFFGYRYDEYHEHIRFMNELFLGL